MQTRLPNLSLPTMERLFFVFGAGPSVNSRSLNLARGYPMIFCNAEGQASGEFQRLVEVPDRVGGNSHERLQNYSQGPSQQIM